MGISTHVLDTARGRPAVGVTVTLERTGPGGWEVVTAAATDDDGRVGELLGDADLAAATYRLTFETGAYHERQGVAGLYPQVAVLFTVTDPDQHHHVPLLLSPFGYTTYRGS